MRSNLGIVLPLRKSTGARLGRRSSIVRALGWVGSALIPLLLTVTIDARDASAHSPHDDVADIAVSPAYADDQTVLAIVRGRVMRSTDLGRTWVEMVRGLGGTGQVLTRVVFAPTNERIVYLTTRSDGVLKSEDGGTSWEAANRGLANLNLQDIAVSPVSPDIAVAAGAVGGLFRTTDGGESWSAVRGIEQVSSLAFLPDGSRVLAGDRRGRLTTLRDAGTTKGRVLTLERGDALTAITIGAAPDSPGSLFVATASGRLFRSDDGGRSYSRRGHGLPDEEVKSLELSPDHATDGTLWASTWRSGVFRSVDDGDTWTPITDGLTTDPSADVVKVPHFRRLAVGVDRSGHTSLFVGGFDGIFRYDDDDSTWDAVETLSDYIAGLAVSPDFGNDKTIAVTTYVKGAFLSRDAGRTWRSVNDGLTVGDLGPGNMFAPIRRLHGVVFSPDYANDGTIFSAYGVQILKSANQGASWEQIAVSPPPPGGDLRQFVLAVSPSYPSDHTVFVATRQGEVFRSEGSGEAGTWTQVGGLGVDERVRSLAASPNYASDRTLYAGTVTGVYTSADGGSTWDATGPRMAAEPQRFGTDGGALVAVSPAYRRDRTVFAGTDSGLLVTRDAGRSWTEITAAPLTDGSQIEAVAVSPDYQNDRTVLVSTRERGLLRSSDGGMSFEPVGTELIKTNHLVADFSNPTSEPIQFSPTFATDRTVFAYAETDVVRSTDGGRSWQVLRLPSSHDVLESLESAPSAHASGVERRWFTTPIGNLSMRRVLAAVAAGLTGFAALSALGVGGRRTGRARAMHVGGGVVVLSAVLLVLAV
jgi:photosystem II stability/assembly factor-like uncharacterized protein